MNMDSLFSGKSPQERDALLRRANQFLATPKGKETMQKLSQNPSLQAKLRQALSGGISTLSKSDRELIFSMLKEELK